MVQANKIDKKFIADIVSRTSFNEDILTKDYYLTKVLYLIKDVEGIYFKGGTALQKIFLNYSRLSEDIDFTVTKNVIEIEKEIKNILKTQDFVKKIENGKSVDKFIRIIIHYDNFSEEEDTIFIDLNERAKLLGKPELYEVRHFYKGYIPLFSVECLSKEEMVAEKVAAAIGRNKPRDHFDVYQIIKNNMPINFKLVEEKCKQSEDEFNIIKMFNNANKLKNRWDNDLVPLLAEETTFQEVMKTLAKYFKLKEAKEAKKKSKIYIY
ncbi:MAG: nucleotidyl transferase AbiEii/AbiGii toxin family protein [Nanoarchaeota archaeon]